MDLNALPEEDDSIRMDTLNYQYSGRERMDQPQERGYGGSKRRYVDVDPMHMSQPSKRIQGSQSRDNGSYDRNSLPSGWLDCPPYGDAVNFIIPSKVPLGESFNDKIVIDKQYTPQHAIRQQRRLGRELGLVIDLTNTNRYYRESDWTREGIKYVKIRCTGRDSVPDNESVEKFIKEVTRFSSQHAHSNKYVLVHCTHGHNRTGYMIVHYLIRSESVSLTEAINRFSKARPPGIYKQDYIDDLCNSFGEQLPRTFVCPQTPEWKRSPDRDDDVASGFQGNDFQANQMTNDLGEGDMTNIVGTGEMPNAVGEDETENVLVPREMTSDDILGEPVPFNKMESMRQFCNDVLKLNSRLLEIPLVDGMIKEADVSRPSYVNLLIDSLWSSDNVDLQEYAECIVQGNSCSKEKKPVDHLLMTLASEWTQNDNMNSWTIGRSSHDFDKLVPQHLAVAHLSCIRLGTDGGRLVQNLMWRYSSCTMVSSNLEPESTVCHEDEALFGDLFCDRGRSAVGSVDGYDQSVIAASSLTHVNMPLRAAAKLFIILKTSAFSSLWTSSIYENAHKKLTAYLLVMKAKEVTSIQAEVRFDGIKTDRVFSSFLGQFEVIYGSLTDGLEGLDYGMSGSGGSKKRKDDSDGYEVAEPLMGKKPRRELIEQDQLTNLWPSSELKALPATVRGRLLDRIARSKLVLKRVKGDGNCQFRSISKVLKGTQRYYKTVREKIMKEMTDHAQLYMDYGSSLKVRGWRMHDKRYYDYYVREMTEDEEWGDFITLFAAANVWNVRVTLICSFKEVAVKEFVPTNLRFFKDIYLCYTYHNDHDAHYDALMPKKDVIALNPTPSPARKPVHAEYRVIVKNIPYSATSDQLRGLFLKFGRVINARVIYTRDGRSRGFGFVVVEDDYMMEKAIAGMDGRLWWGREIQVTDAMKNYHDLEAYAGV